MGIEHVYDSRSTEFADQIRRDTDGYGVDIVLNSLTGAAQRAGLELLAFGGRFVEIGKRDVYGNTRLGLYPVPPQPDVLLRRPGADVATATPSGFSELLRTVYRAGRRRCAAAAGAHRTTRSPRRPPRSG